MKKCKVWGTLLSMALLMGSGCLSDSGIKKKFDSNAKSLGVFVVTTDYLTGGAGALIHGDPPVKVKEPDVQISSDPAVRSYGGKIYVINRFGFDNIQVINPKKDYLTVAQYTTGTGSNPQDIAFASEKKAYVSRFNDAQLRVLDPRDGTILSNVDLAAYADADGLPEPAKMLVVGDRLFVAVQRLFWFAPTDKSYVIVIDTTNSEIVGDVELATLNPVSELVYDKSKDKIYVACSGAIKYFGTLGDDGAIESISIDMDADTYTSDGVLIDEAALGGDATALAMAASNQAYAVIQDVTGTNILIRFDPTDPGAGFTEIWRKNSYIPAITIDSKGYLYIADADFAAPGVLVFDTATDAKVTDTSLDVGMPPVGFAEVGQ